MWTRKLHVHTWNSLPSTCCIWLESLPCLDEKTTQQKSDAGFVLNFSGQKKQVGMEVLFMLRRTQQHNSLIGSYINTNSLY